MVPMAIASPHPLFPDFSRAPVRLRTRVLKGTGRAMPASRVSMDPPGMDTTGMVPMAMAAMTMGMMHMARRSSCRSRMPAC